MYTIFDYKCEDGIVVFNCYSFSLQRKEPTGRVVVREADHGEKREGRGGGRLFYLWPLHSQVTDQEERNIGIMILPFLLSV
jgi:hypothetical protein